MLSSSWDYHLALVDESYGWMCFFYKLFSQGWIHKFLLGGNMSSSVMLCITVLRVGGILLLFINPCLHSPQEN